jgi:hypothetical protein
LYVTEKGSVNLIMVDDFPLFAQKNWPGANPGICPAARVSSRLVISDPETIALTQSHMDCGNLSLTEVIRLDLCPPQP